MDKIYNFDELCTESGMVPRTVRYYIQRKLLNPPEGGGRGAYYTEEHLKTLLEIKRLADEGVPLSLMKKLLDNPESLNTVQDNKPSTTKKIESKMVEVFTLRSGLTLMVDRTALGKASEELLDKIIELAKEE